MIDIYTTIDFKVGDKVWLTSIEFTPSGRCKYRYLPRQVVIQAVAADYIDFGTTVNSYYIPRRFFVRNKSYGCTRKDGYNFLCDIGYHVGLTKEEATQKYNKLIEMEVEYRREQMIRFEDRIRGYLL